MTCTRIIISALFFAFILTFNQIQNLQTASLPAVFFVWSVGAWCKVAGSVQHASAVTPRPLARAAATPPSLEGVGQTGPLPAVGHGGVVRVGGAGLAGAQQQTREVSSCGVLFIGDVGGLPVGAKYVVMAPS